MPAAKYDTIYESLRKAIEDQEYPYQSTLPSEHQLVQLYDCSRNTVRRAIAELGEQGYVQSVHGKGVLVLYRKQEQTQFSIGGIEINRSNRSVRINGQDVNLTAKEFELLYLLSSHPGQVFSREQLLESVWKNDKLGDLRTVDVHVRRLREKIEANPGQPGYILTKWKVGYYFADK